MARAVEHDRSMQDLTTVLSLEALATVGGGQDQELKAFGRCGPEDRWRWLGDVYTPQCAAHDAALRSARQSGSSRWMAHLRAAPLLPAAVGSYVRHRWSGQ